MSDLLEIESRREDGVVTIGASGELDIGSARTLRAAIDEALGEAAIASLVLDLSATHVLRLDRDGDARRGEPSHPGWRRRVRHRPLWPSDDAALSVFELSGLDDVLPFLDAA